MKSTEMILLAFIATLAASLRRIAVSLSVASIESSSRLVGRLHPHVLVKCANADSIILMRRVTIFIHGRSDQKIQGDLYGA